MVKLINWRKATDLEQKIDIGSIIRTTTADVIMIPLNKGKIVEYIKSTDLDTMEPLIIRIERKINLRRELRRWEREGFKVQIVLPNFVLKAD
ncbi:hypothetical protein [Metallosphaera hakonensis]|uniref:Uncharacterized protein n=1 Tax=Metallosphaera hakonensis JCM 8857 = DSM 7519 TaxID=1293036 RepID=A0A2U9IVJ7_9CREN|nr:hypothetical protein [Metallosphaera hakonensis]AWS00080.1 hypothetical protein DFR87_10750 [Metallosphaera hakonensis JCM 8857 = DSM 7519]